MSVKLISITPDAEKLIAYCARVSSKNQDNPDVAKLLAYCIKHKHWSVFEQADMTVEIITSRAIAQQILRHKSFCFQEFSQRYAAAQELVIYEARRQDLKNRQNSIDDLEWDVKEWFITAQQDVWAQSLALYEKALYLGIAKESARFLLPLNTQTKLYMKGNIRSWINYFQVRCGEDTQLEHRSIALQIRDYIFKQELPIIGGLI